MRSPGLGASTAEVGYFSVGGLEGTSPERLGWNSDILWKNPNELFGQPNKIWFDGNFSYLRIREESKSELAPGLEGGNKQVG